MGVYRCVCGNLWGRPSTTTSTPENHQPRGLTFVLSCCRACGHCAAVSPDRQSFGDLTRVQADELRRSPDFQWVREVVETHLMSIGMWG